MFKTTFKIIRYTLYALLVLTGVTFAVSNRAPVDLTFYPLPYALSVPMYLVAVSLFAAGALTVWFITRVGLFSERRLHKKTTKRMQALENEIAALRSEQLLRQEQPHNAMQITAIK